MVERKNTFFKVLIRGSVRDVKINRLKTVYLLDDVESNVDACPADVGAKNAVALGKSEGCNSEANVHSESPKISQQNRHFLVLPKRSVNLRRRKMVNYNENKEPRQNEVDEGGRDRQWQYNA